MKISLLLKRIPLFGAIAFSLLLPGFTTTTTYAAGSMDGMGHANTDLTNCLERHQTPTAPINNESKEIEHEDKDEPTPPVLPYYVAFQTHFTEPIKPTPNLIVSSSYVPPDLVILTSALRI